VTSRFPAPDLSPAALSAVTAEIASTAAEYDRTAALPWAGLQAAHRAGLLTAGVGVQFGGPGLGPREIARILTAIGEGDASVGLLASNLLMTHAGQAANPSWPTAFYEDLLRRSEAGPALANAIRAEPELGAPARGGLPRTTLTSKGDGWVLNGHKAYATGGTGLAYHVVWAVTDDDRVGHVIVPGDAPGITWIETWDHLGLRASNTHDVVYEDVVVPAGAFTEIPRGADGVYRDPAAMAGPGGFSIGICMYFSAETYTSLGFGDITPVGPIRLLAGIEALNGLLLIGWSASFTYIAMERFWDADGASNPRP